MRGARVPGKSSRLHRGRSGTAAGPRRAWWTKESSCSSRPISGRTTVGQVRRACRTAPRASLDLRPESRDALAGGRRPQAARGAQRLVLPQHPLVQRAERAPKAPVRASRRARYECERRSPVRRPGVRCGRGPASRDPLGSPWSGPRTPAAPVADDLQMQAERQSAPGRARSERPCVAPLASRPPRWPTARSRSRRAAPRAKEPTRRRRPEMALFEDVRAVGGGSSRRRGAADANPVGKVQGVDLGRVDRRAIPHTLTSDQLIDAHRLSAPRRSLETRICRAFIGSTGSVASDQSRSTSRVAGMVRPGDRSSWTRRARSATPGSSPAPPPTWASSIGPSSWKRMSSMTAPP